MSSLIPSSDAAQPSSPAVPGAVGPEALTASLVSWPLPRAVLGSLSRALGIEALYSLSGPFRDAQSPQDFARRSLAALGIRVSLDLAPVPEQGPLVFVSNHPFGLLEGLVLLARLTPLRPDLRIMANSLLRSLGTLAGSFIEVDPFETREARQRNVQGLREALRHLEDGGAVAVFPAGTVSHWQKGRGISDPDWHDTALRLSARSGAAIIPLYFQGRNSLSFSVAGLVHPALRTLLLPRELLKKRHSTVSLRLGAAIGHEVLTSLPTARVRNDYLRLRCYALGERKGEGGRVYARPLASPLPPALLEHAIADLPASALLLREEAYSLYLLRGEQSPCLLQEMGRIREMAFRDVGEGTGDARDLDAFDRRYYHLILWNDAAHEITGGYRLGMVPELLRRDGDKGLYTSRLFRFAPAFWERYGQSLELGRAVVRPERQRDFLPLLLLWKGIARFVLRHPSIRYLFGPVSMNLGVSPFTLRLLASYFMGRHGDGELARLVRARIPFRAEARGDAAGEGFLDAVRQGLLDYRGLDRLIRAQEEGRGIPILFKHYFKMGGRIAALHRDAGFGSLDAFLLVDLPHAPETMLRRYMGREDAAAYAARHLSAEEAAPPQGSPHP